MSEVVLDSTTCPMGCGSRAVVLDRFILESTDGPVEHYRTSCPNRHHYTGPTGR